MNDLHNKISRRLSADLVFLRMSTLPLKQTFSCQQPVRRLTSMGSMSLAMEGERERDLMWDLGSSSRDGVLDGVKLSTEST